ncbi:hypothetical protein MASR1M97_04490 [Candidatus Desulfobacillus denitrificans]
MYRNLNEIEFNSIPEDAWRKLGCYVYALRDPCDKRVFYIGKGGGTGAGNNRVYDHFIEAEKPARDGSKLNRIRAIWKSGKKVDWFIVRRNIDEQTALQIEGSLIDAFGSVRFFVCEA